MAAHIFWWPSGCTLFISFLEENEKLWLIMTILGSWVAEKAVRAHDVVVFYSCALVVVYEA